MFRSGAILTTRPSSATSPGNGTPETLNLLTLLTFADSQGTSDKLWNDFKDSLLWPLHAAMTLLTGGTEFIRAAEKAARAAVRKCATRSPNASPRRSAGAFCFAAGTLF